MGDGSSIVSPTFYLFTENSIFHHFGQAGPTKGHSMDQKWSQMVKMGFFGPFLAIFEVPKIRKLPKNDRLRLSDPRGTKFEKIPHHFRGVEAFWPTQGLKMAQKWPKMAKMAIWAIFGLNWDILRARGAQNGEKSIFS